MRHSYRPDIPPQPQPYRTQVLDHLGLVAGMFEELGIAEVIDHATRNRSVTVCAIVRPQATIRVLVVPLESAQDTPDKTIHD